LEKQKKGGEIHTTPLALLCNETLSRPIGNSTKENKKMPKFSSITAVIHYSSTKATSGRSEIGRTSISGSFSLLLSFGEAKERRERPDHSARFALPQKLFKAIMKTPYIKQIINSEDEQCYCSLSLQ
jgi:hypothetical protein